MQHPKSQTIPKSHPLTYKLFSVIISTILCHTIIYPPFRNPNSQSAKPLAIYT